MLGSSSAAPGLSSVELGSQSLHAEDISGAGPSFQASLPSQSDVNTGAIPVISAAPHDQARSNGIGNRVLDQLEALHLDRPPSIGQVEASSAPPSVSTFHPGPAQAALKPPSVDPASQPFGDFNAATKQLNDAFNYAISIATVNKISTSLTSSMNKLLSAQ